MTLTEFQEKTDEMLFTRRQVALHTLQEVVRDRLGAPIAWPDLLLHITPADFDTAYALASADGIMEVMRNDHLQ